MDAELVARVVNNLSVLLTDENVAVVKKLLLSLAQVYKTALQVNIIDFSIYSRINASQSYERLVAWPRMLHR